MEYKQVIVVIQSLKLPKGKLAAQAAHASVESVLRLLDKDKDLVKKWRNGGMKKVVLKVATQKELYQYKTKAEDYDLQTAVITDAGKTVVAPGTVTCMAIGPAEEDKVDSVIADLSLL